MKSEQILIRLSPEELEQINAAYKEALVNADGILTRTAFIRDILMTQTKPTKRK